MRTPAICAALFAAALGAALQQVEPTAPRADESLARAVEFETLIRPLFAARCVACHGEKKQAGGLRLDRRADALAGARGGTVRVLVPGDPSASRVLERVLATDEDERMPQDAEALDAREIELLRAWIAAGAVWPDDGSRLARHWAYVAPRAIELPEVKSPSECRNAIDRFVLANLEREELGFASEAEPALLLRRAALDLTGLPPTLEELDAFERDARADAQGVDAAYERALERLLASPQYAEKQAQHWLDLARYADTNGYEKDERRSLWPWRDWVIHAFDADMGFDRFTLEQLAGDLLPDATQGQRIATGFQRNTLINQEGGTDPEEFRDAAVVDRTNTLGSVWLGSTLACAQCHDHKYDPFTQKEYFQLYAFFDQTTDTGNQPDPVLSLPTPEQESELAEIERKKKELDELTRAAESEATRELEGRRAELADPPAWRELMLGDPPEASCLTAGGAVDGSTLLGPPPSERAAACSRDDVLLPLVQHDAFPATPTSLSVLRLDLRFAQGQVIARTQGDRKPIAVTLTLEHGDGTTVKRVPLAGGILESETSDVARQARANADGSVTLDWDLPPAAVERRALAYYALVTPLRRPRPEALFVRLRIDGSLVAPLRILAASSDDPRLASSVGAFLPGAWETADALEIESTPTALGKDFGLEPGGVASTSWTRHPDWRDGTAQSLPGERRVHFARRSIILGESRTLRISFGGDDAFRLWIDGELIASRDDWPGFLERQVRVERRLDAGEHTLLAKIPNSSGPGQLWCELRALASERVPEVVAESLRIEERLRDARQRGIISLYARRIAAERGGELEARRKALAADEEKLRARIATTLVLEELKKPRVTRIHAKGSYLSPTDIVKPDVPSFLPSLPTDAPRNRLGLARWLVSGENPLTARVFVNRTWERFFGRGLVASSDDFGVRGDLPTHPELLDWLARDFVEHGWSVKHLCRTIASSRTYRQASGFTRALLERDAENRLLARQSRPRLEAETLRDVALASSGLLARDAASIGGPSVMPPQPDGVWAPVYSNDTWQTATGPARHRRGLYTFWRRSSPYATFQLFDAPSREQTCTRRARTNTPLQALALLNDPAFVECAEALGKRIAAEVGDTRARAAWGWRAATSRAPAAQELDTIAELFESERAQGELVAWTHVASVLLNLDEVLTRP